ncbi:MAG: hypothetical protein SFT90_04835 [Rickettsiales bacterium]|nr:hypothetical protein [Rickettsiales bacterium]
MTYRINNEIETELPNLKTKFLVLKYLNKEIHKLSNNYDFIAKEIDEIEEYVANSIYARKLKKSLKKIKKEIIKKLKSVK